MWHLHLCLSFLIGNIPLPLGVCSLSGSLSRTCKWGCGALSRCHLKAPSLDAPGEGEEVDARKAMKRIPLCSLSCSFSDVGFMKTRCVLPNQLVHVAPATWRLTALGGKQACAHQRADPAKVPLCSRLQSLHPTLG